MIEIILILLAGFSCVGVVAFVSHKFKAAISSGIGIFVCVVFMLAFQYLFPKHLNEAVENREKSILMIKKSNAVTKDYRGSYPIHKAASMSNLDEVKELITLGADVNVQDRWGKTPLHYANIYSIIELLMAEGADINARDNKGETPLDYAIWCKKNRPQLDYFMKQAPNLIRKYGGKTKKELDADVKGEISEGEKLEEI